MRTNKRTIATFALIAVACDDPTTAPPREITLHFCGVRWAAYQNEGEAWTSISSTQSPVTVSATERLAIATVTVSGPSAAPVLEIRYLSAEQAAATFTCGAPTPATKQLRGSVTGLGPGATVAISMGDRITTASATAPTFQVRAPADGPADLLATHQSPFTPSPRADRIIIRRDENHADGATMPVLDFSSSEAFAPQANTLTIEGLAAGRTVSVQTHLRTRRGASSNLNYDFDQSSTVVTTYSLPASRVAEGDLHRTEVDSRTTGAVTDRSVVFFYRNPTDRTMALGPVASTPAFTTSAGQVRIDVAAQPEYGSQIEVVLAQPQPAPSNNTVVISATKEYFRGTPATWSLVIPDLSGVPGFSPLWGLPRGGIGSAVRVTGLPYRFDPASARDGDVYRSAYAFRVFQHSP